MAYTKVRRVFNWRGDPVYKIECNQCSTMWWRMTHPAAVNKAHLHAVMEGEKTRTRRARMKRYNAMHNLVESEVPLP